MDRPSSSDRSDRSATKRSVQQSPVSRPVHSEHSTCHRSHQVPGYRSQPGTRYHPVTTRYPVPGARVTAGAPVTHWAILPWARYCRIDPLGLNQNALWTDLLLGTGLTGQLRKDQFSSHRSANLCTMNILPEYRVPGYRSRPSTRYRADQAHWSHGEHRSALVRKLKRYRPTSAWTSLSYLFLIHRSEWYN